MGFGGYSFLDYLVWRLDGSWVYGFKVIRFLGLGV